MTIPGHYNFDYPRQHTYTRTQVATTALTLRGKASVSKNNLLAIDKSVAMPAGSAVESPSPIGIANLPNQRHKIVAKRGAAFTIMVSDVGA